MQFIEMSGGVLLRLLRPDEMDGDELRSAGVNDECVVRVNQQGDIELRRPEGWDVIGGLLGDFDARIKRETGLEWA